MKKTHPHKINTELKSTIPEKKQTLLFWLLICFCIPVIIYIQTTRFELVHFDDDMLITKNSTFLSNPANISQAFFTDAFIVKTSPFYRPLQTVSYIADSMVSGVENAWMFHVSNIILLGLIACVLFLLLRKFYIPPKLALFSTLIYCTHPLFVSSVAWIPARGDLLLTLFTLLSFLFLTKLLEERRIIPVLLHWATFTTALFCKETAVLLPVLFIFYILTTSAKNDKYKTTGLLLLLYLISLLCWFILRNKAVGDFQEEQHIFTLTTILSNLPTIAESLSKFFLPFDMAPIPAYSAFKIISGIVIMVIFSILFSKKENGKKNQKILALAWFLLLLAPTLVYKHELIDYLDHRFFLPLIGILLFILLQFPKKWLKEGDIKNPLIFMLIVVFLSCLSFVKSSSYRTPETFYNLAIEKNPNSALAYNNRATIKSIAGDSLQALADFDKAVELQPDYYQAFCNRGIIKFNKGDNQGALADFNVAIGLKNNFADPYYFRGIINLNIRKLDEAIQDLDTYLYYNPNSAAANNFKGMAIGSKGNVQEAIKYFDKAIELFPNYLEAYGNRAIARNFIKDYAGALADCEKVLQLNPKEEKAIKLKKLLELELQKK